MRKNWLGSSTKVRKSLGWSVYTPVMYFDPSVKGICPYKGKCALSCLGPNSGRGVMNNVRKSRNAKTIEYLSNVPEATAAIIADVLRHERYATKRGYTYMPRLNGTSDIDFSKVYDALPHVNFYDYTKNVQAYRAWMLSPRPNHHLTLSYDPSTVNMAVCLSVLADGGSVAIVMDTDTLPDTYQGYRVVNGDLFDARPLDRQVFNIPHGEGYWVALTLKGTLRAKQLARETGFAIPVNV